MFGKDNSSAFSLLDQSVDISCNELICKNIDILGRVKGLIKAQNVFIKNNGSITGQVFCQDNLKMEKGCIEGDITASYIYLYKGSVLKGKIRYTNLHIEEGATIESDDIKKITQAEIDDFFVESENTENEV
jgi:cytoskeletal protein CcmA (bactofilin family)